MDNISFKKRVKKKDSLTTAHKRSRMDEDEDPSHEPHERRVDGDAVKETLQTIDELREEQKLRAQLLRAEQQQQHKRKRTTVASEGSVSASESQYGLHDPKKDGSAGQKLLNLLDGQFTGQSGVTQRDQHEELANKYIEERLQKRAAAEVNEASELPALTDEDALYAHLRKEVGGPKTATESADGGVLVWNTGIAEVELPPTYHEKTVRETMHALEKERVSSQTKVQSSALPTNFSTDFNRHKSEFIAELKALPREEQRTIGFVAAPNKHEPSDDHAVSRFRKMESRRRHK